jgi:Mg-chelatase subunit ChlD
MEKISLNRWRLILGKNNNENSPLPEEYKKIDSLLDFLYDREYSDERDIRGTLDESNLTVPKWVEGIREFFPNYAVEQMEDEALKNYGLDELLRDPQILEKLSPNINLLKSILSLKDSIGGEALETAKKIVAQVVEEIRKKLEKEIKAAFRGKKLNNVYNGQKSIRNLDIKKTLRANLKNYNKDMGHIVIERPYFNQRQKEYNKWSVVILVDESGSMLDSVIHSAIMAGIFADLKSLDTKLVIFDTEIVDLSSHIDDIVRTLMSVRLGGGTNITKALKYGESLISNPSKTIVVLVSDLYEGWNYGEMYSKAKNIIENGSKLICLTSLDDVEGSGIYDKNAAKILKRLGADVASLTPGRLAQWISEIIS